MYDWIARVARNMATRIMGELEAEVVAAHQSGGGALGSIFSIQRTGDLKKLCKHAQIAKKELAYIIIACERGWLPWRHRISHRNFIPEHLHPTDDEMNSIGEALIERTSIPKALRKIMSQFNERRMLVGHIFYNDDLSRWHLLYFDQRDSSSYNNHWKAGSHIHLINWLLRPGQNANDAWTGFHEGNPNLRGSLHIRCVLE